MNDPATTRDRKLRILHVLRAPLGGAFRHVLDLACEQVALGHDVGLVVDRLAGDDSSIRRLAEIGPALRLGVAHVSMPRHLHPRDLAAVVGIARLSYRLRVDVIHGHGFKGGLYARLPGLLYRGKIICCHTPHGDTPYGGRSDRAASPLVQAAFVGVERLLAARTDVLLFESVFTANRFRQGIGEVPALVRIVHSGIGPAAFVPVTANADAADFVHVQEPHAPNGIDMLIDAVALMTARATARGARPPQLILVGSGPDKTELAGRAERRGIQSQVSFADDMPTRQAFSLGRILVVPRRAESLPYLVLEAAGAQIPMVATIGGGIDEIFGPYRDGLIAGDDPRALAAAMGTALEADHDEVRRQAMDFAAFVSSRFAVAIMAASVIAGYREGFARRRSSRASGDVPARIPQPCSPHEALSEL